MNRFSQLHAHRAQDRADGFGRASLASNYLPEVTLMDAQLEDGKLLAFNRADMNLVGVVHECFWIASTSSFMVLLGRGSIR